MTDSHARKPFLAALKGEAIQPPPIWLMRQAGRYLPEYREVRNNVGSFLELCYTPELAIEVTLQPLRRYDFDAAILFSDILVVPDGLGQKVAFKQGEGPQLEAVRGAADLDRLSGARVVEHLAPVYEAVKGIKAALPATTALIGFAGAPWTVATYMVEGAGSKDYAATKAMAYGDPALFQRLIDLVVDATVAHLDAQIRAGAEAVQIFDSWAGVLPEDAFRQWVITPNRAIVSRLKAEHPQVPVIGFPRGAGVLYEAFVEETGVDAVSLDTTMPLAWAAERLQSKVTVQGNLDPQLLVVGGAAQDAAVDRIKAALGAGPFIFNLGHGIPLTTPPEHVARLVERVRGG